MPYAITPSKQRQHVERHVRAVSALFAETRRPVLDLGCGQGLFAGTTATYVGLDPDAENLAKLRDEGRTVILADARAAPIRDESCDGILCINMLNNVADPVAVIREIDRLLVPGGRAYIKADLSRRGAHPRRFRWIKDLRRRLAFSLHPLRHRDREIHTLRVARGATSICPACFERFFRSRRYSFSKVRKNLFVVRKGASSNGLRRDAGCPSDRH